MRSSSRIVESTIIAIGAISLLAIVTLHQESTADASALLVQGESLVAVHDLTFPSGPGCVGVGNGIILGALMWKWGYSHGPGRRCQSDPSRARP